MPWLQTVSAGIWKRGRRMPRVRNKGSREAGGAQGLEQLQCGAAVRQAWAWVSKEKAGSFREEKTPAHPNGTFLAQPLLQNLSCYLIEVL